MSLSDRRRPDEPAGTLTDAVRAALDGAGIGWALLRAPAPGAATSDDVDLLVAEAQRGELDGVLTAAGYRRLPGAGQGSHRFYVGYDPGRDEWVTLDVVTEVAFGRRLEFPTPTAVDLLRRARRVAGVPVLDPDDAFWHRLLHHLLDKEAVTPQARATLAALAAQARPAGPLAGVVDELRPGNRSAAAVLALVAHGDAAAVTALAADLRGAWRARDRRRVWTRMLHSRLARAHLTRPVPAAPTGLAVAILGPDGAGKTTLAEALARSLPLPTRVVYMGVWRDHPADRWLRFVPGARLALRCARLTARSLASAYHRRRGRVVLLDRFTYDAALPSDDLDWRGKVTAAVTLRLARHPDAVLLLDAPAEVMYARKGEQGVGVLARDRLAYRRLVAEHGRSTVIDAMLPAVQVRARAHDALWQLLAPAGS